MFTLKNIGVFFINLVIKKIYNEWVGKFLFHKTSSHVIDIGKNNLSEQAFETGFKHITLKDTTFNFQELMQSFFFLSKIINKIPNKNRNKVQKIIPKILINKKVGQKIKFFLLNLVV